MIVEKRYTPKVVRPSSRLLRKAERKDLIEVERVRRYVESIGGEAAFQRRMEVVAASHGSTYGSPVMPRRKTYNPATYFEAEVPMRQVESRAGAIRTARGMLIFPGGLATATVPIPRKFRTAFSISAHSTSTFARCGLNILHSQAAFNRQITRTTLPQTMQVSMHNLSATPVLVREGDPVRLINTSELMGVITSPKVLTTAPRTRAVGKFLKLHAGNQLVRVNPGALSKIRIGGVKVKYIDPHAPKFGKQFTTGPFNDLKVEPGDFFVISTKENYSVPPGHVAFVQDASDSLHHSTARLVHPGSSGILALEFLALRGRTIKPGNGIAFLTAHKVNGGVTYRGRYKQQESAAPKGQQ